MTFPRLEIDLDKIEHNARSLVMRLASSGISVTGVTKALLGSPQISAAILRAGVDGLGDSRIENVERLRCGDVSSRITLIRTPMLSQVDRVVRYADISFNTELDVVAALSSSAQKSAIVHNVVLMVELGDLREGLLPCDVLNAVEVIQRLPNIQFKGIGANLACLSGVSPDDTNMSELSSLANSIDAKFGPITEIVSGGNSANINWALSGAETGRINNLRLGEALLFGREALHREPIEGLHVDAMTLVAEVIEVKIKPSRPWGELAQNAFGEAAKVSNCGPSSRAVVAIGRQDIDPSGLTPPAGMTILGASSDHLVLDVKSFPVTVGDTVTFQVNYSAFLRAMTSPFVHRLFSPHKPQRSNQKLSGPRII